MSISLFRYAEKAGFGILYINTQQGQIVRILNGVTTNSPMHNLELSDLLQPAGFSFSEQQDNIDKKIIDIYMEAYLKAPTIYRNLCKSIQAYRMDEGEWIRIPLNPFPKKPNVNPPTLREVALIKSLNDSGGLIGYNDLRDSIMLKPVSQETFSLLLQEGKILEMYLYNLVNDLDIPGMTLHANVKITDPQESETRISNEYDLVCVHDATATYFECKTGFVDKKLSAHLDTFQANAPRYSGVFSKKCFTDRFRQYPSIQERAHHE